MPRKSTRSAISQIPEIFQEATWIWPVPYTWDLYNCYAAFRKSFELDNVPKAAPLYITADQSYKLYVNGQYVCRGPARGFQSHWPFDEVDVAPLLCQGRNTIAVRAYNPGQSNFQYISQSAAGLLVAASWGKFKLVSDLSWKCRPQDAVQKNTVPASTMLFPQEYFDARLESEDWISGEYNDENWRTPVSAGHFGAMPWHSVEPRMIPLLQERTIHPQALLGEGMGRCAPRCRSTRDVVMLRLQEDVAHLPTEGSPETLTVMATGRDQYRSYLLDFGRTITGSLVLKVDGAQGGEIVDTLHVERIDYERLAPKVVLDPRCRMRFGQRLICRPGKTTHAFHHYYGFRYLVLTVRESIVDLQVQASVNWVGYPLERKGGFTSSDRLLERIWETCAWTQQCCSLDAYVDTPWRGQVQWWGDARVHASNTFHLNGDARLLRRGIHCIAGQTAPSGLTYGHAPTNAHHCVIPDFTVMWLLTLWDHYWQTGTVEAFQAHEATVEKALQYFREQTDGELGLVGNDPRYRLFLDAADIFKDGYSSVYNLWLLLALEKLAELFKLAKNSTRAKELDKWAKELRGKLVELINDEGLLCDGLTIDGDPVASTSIHAQTLALMADLDSDSERSMLEKILLPFIRGEAQPEAYPSAYWVTYAFTVLAERGYGADVLAFIKKYWAPMVEQGTTFENFPDFMQEGRHSCSHAWSAHPLYHCMQIIGGLRQSGPAWDTVDFRPSFIGERGGASIPSPLGAIASRWERGAEGIDVRLSLPKGVKAKVVLPGLKPTIVSGTQNWRIPAGQTSAVTT